MINEKTRILLLATILKVARCPGKFHEFEWLAKKLSSIISEMKSDIKIPHLLLLQGEIAKDKSPI